MPRLICTLLLLFAAVTTLAQQANTVVLWEEEFPSGGVTRAQLMAAIPAASLVTADALPASLLQARVLLLPYGSAFPESAWPAISDFLQRGGNLVAVGGRPLTRPAYRGAGGR